MSVASLARTLPFTRYRVERGGVVVRLATGERIEWPYHTVWSLTPDDVELSDLGPDNDPSGWLRRLHIDSSAHTVGSDLQWRILCGLQQAVPLSVRAGPALDTRMIRGAIQSALDQGTWGWLGRRLAEWELGLQLYGAEAETILAGTFETLGKPRHYGAQERRSALRDVLFGLLDTHADHMLWWTGPTWAARLEWVLQTHPFPWPYLDWPNPEWAWPAVQ